MSIKICTFNVKGLNDSSKRQQLFQFLKLNNYSICFLQELHCEEKTYDIWKKEWGGEIFLSGNSRNSAGVGILVHSKLSCDVIEYKTIIDGRMQLLKLNINYKDILLLNLYAPNNAKDNISFLSRIEELIIDNDNETLIVGGDFNTVIDIDNDKKNGNLNNNKKNRDKIKQIIENNDINDIYRILNPSTKHYTWHSNDKPPIFCRLDYFLVSSNIVNKISQCKITTGFRSDHSIVFIDFNINDNERGPGFFKLNNSVIFDQEYQNKIKKAINDIVEINIEANPMTLWEIIKGTIRNESIKYTSYKKKLRIQTELKLKNEIDELEIKFSNNPNETNILEEIVFKKSELNKIIDDKTNGFLLRAKAEWIEGAEKNTKYFSNLEKKRAESKTINS